MNTNLGMTYQEKVAHGNAGEFYFAYWISNKFVWPCRILDIDMGLDAQVEIYDNKNNSTGMFIGIQVKTTAKTLDESPSISVPLKNIVYWESISDPIILIRICLNNGGEIPSLYWQHLNKEKLKSYIQKGNESISFRFTKTDKLKIADNTKWKKLFLSSNDLEFIERIEGINNTLINYGKLFKKNLPNGWNSNEPQDDINELLNEYDGFQRVINMNPRILFLSSDMKKLQENYNKYIELIKDGFEEMIKRKEYYHQDFNKYTPLNPLIQSWLAS
ncbi:DUF4365 domain-containing protein [Proteus terrae]|uniref:DUF4365 domain-containing protein n=1 Tax=Proteus terrae TaxID=1574161 RepID=UPI001F41EEFF|nr:DUF4365 domain-containing protein [Proteus terrae]